MTKPASWEPRNPAFDAVVRESFSRQAMMTTLGASIVHLAPGEIHLAAPYAPQFTQQNGFWHAGAVASLADSANGYAAFSLAAPGTDVLAVEFKINLLAAARGIEEPLDKIIGCWELQFGKAADALRVGRYVPHDLPLRVLRNSNVNFLNERGMVDPSTLTG